MAFAALQLFPQCLQSKTLTGLNCSCCEARAVRRLDSCRTRGVSRVSSLPLGLKVCEGTAEELLPAALCCFLTLPTSGCRSDGECYRSARAPPARGRASSIPCTNQQEGSGSDFKPKALGRGDRFTQCPEPRSTLRTAGFHHAALGVLLRAPYLFVSFCSAGFFVGSDFFRTKAWDPHVPLTLWKREHTQHTPPQLPAAREAPSSLAQHRDTRLQLVLHTAVWG